MIKVASQITEIKMNFLIKCQGNWVSQLEENINSDLYFMPYKRINSKCITFLSAENKNNTKTRKNKSEFLFNPSVDAKT